MLIVGTLVISPLDLFGHKTKNNELSDNKKNLYSHMRHPFLLGLSLLFFTTPTMTRDRLMLAVILALYIYASSDIQQEDLVYVDKELNDSYSEMDKRLKFYWGRVCGRV